MKELDLNELRRSIDNLDRQLAQVLEQRLRIVMDVAAYKKEHGLPVKDAAREAKVIEKVTGFLNDQTYAPALEKIMRSIMDAACVLEEDALKEESKADIVLRVGYFGAPGSFTCQAAEEYFRGRQYEAVPLERFEDVVQAVKNGSVAYGVLPIENSSTGGITEVYDLLRAYDCSIIGERCVKIEQNLVGCKGATLADVRRVYSHPQGFAQSRDFFSHHQTMELIPYFSTSKSAALVAQSNDKTMAAVAGRRAADLYGLEVLAANINYNVSNYTRFVIIAKEPRHIAGSDKITLILAVKHEPGSLYKILGHFYERGLNLTNLESRPITGKSWEYFFHIDVTGSLTESEVQSTLQDLEKSCTFFKVLGNYPADCNKGAK